jgi:hypothetical protein
MKVRRHVARGFRSRDNARFGTLLIGGELIRRPT